MGTEQTRTTQAPEPSAAAPAQAVAPSVRQPRGNEAAQTQLAARRNAAAAVRDRAALALGETGPEEGAFERFRTARRRELSFLGQRVEVAEAMIAPMQAAEARILETASSDPAHGIRQAGGWDVRNAGLHTWGLAVDLNYFSNPYVMHEDHEGTERGGAMAPGSLDAQLAPVYHRIAALMLNRESVIPRQMLGSRSGAAAMELYDRLAEESQAMRDYFALLENGAADGRADTAPAEASPRWDAPLDAQETPRGRPVRPGAGVRMDPLDRWIAAHAAHFTSWSGVAGTAAARAGQPDADRVRSQMAADWRVLTARRAVPGAHAQNGDPISADAAPTPEVGSNRRRPDRPFDNSGGNTPNAQRDPRRGLMDLRREVVEGMLRAGFQWGGASWESGNGDLMHFQLPASNEAVRTVQRAEAAARAAGGGRGDPPGRA